MPRLAANHNSEAFIHAAEIHSGSYLGICEKTLAKSRCDLQFYSLLHVSHKAANYQLEKYACHLNVCFSFAQQRVKFR